MRQIDADAMNLILVKMFATALALARSRPGRTRSRPNSIRSTDQAEVVQLLKAGCAHMRKAFDIEDLNLDDLIDTAMADTQAVAGEITAFRGINFDDLHIAYKQFCKQRDGRQLARSTSTQVIEFYNSAAADLPDHNRLKDLKLPGTSVVLDGKGEQVRRAVRVRPPPRLGAARARSRNTCSRRSSPPRTSASISTRASTSAA